MIKAPTVLAVCGGVGGAKLALGLQRVLPPGELAVLVNTGDDFTHLGLRICPDLDTVLYTLAGVVHPQQGWGRAEETFGFMSELRQQGGPEWFLLGDRDLVVHVERTRRVGSGERLTSVMADLAQRFGVRTRILPMADSEPLLGSTAVLSTTGTQCTGVSVKRSRSSKSRESGRLPAGDRMIPSLSAVTTSVKFWKLEIAARLASRIDR